MELQVIQNKIFEVRGYRVMLDFHLAELYNVKTKVLKQAVKRNIQRFPSDFMFELDKEEFHQLVTICDQLVVKAEPKAGKQKTPLLTGLFGAGSRGRTDTPLRGAGF